MSATATPGRIEVAVERAGHRRRGACVHQPDETRAVVDALADLGVEHLDHGPSIACTHEDFFADVGRGVGFDDDEFPVLDARAHAVAFDA